jgi:hypothetical protein
LFSTVEAGFGLFLCLKKVGAAHGRDEGEDVVRVAGNGLGRVVSGLSVVLGKKGSFDRRDSRTEGEEECWGAAVGGKCLC